MCAWAWNCAPVSFSEIFALTAFSSILSWTSNPDFARIATLDAPLAPGQGNFPAMRQSNFAILHQLVINTSQPCDQDHAAEMSPRVPNDFQFSHADSNARTVAAAFRLDAGELW